MRNVLGDHRLAQAAAADQEDIGGRRYEVQRHQFRDRPLITLLRPRPVEIGQRLEASDMGAAQPPFERAAGTFAFFPRQQRIQPGLLRTLGPVREDPVQLQSGRALAAGIIRHPENLPSTDRSHRACAGEPGHPAASHAPAKAPPTAAVPPSPAGASPGPGEPHSDAARRAPTRRQSPPSVRPRRKLPAVRSARAPCVPAVRPVQPLA
ncbi:MAG: hypothetical protein AW09_000553 [Candidatus Accumulibacter phosphatis]|uniref:Uncharacterized protein n=1 Tax=Candidatus Accumulibacter phosphatis TaxID=327160 RepID=A0A080LZ54_9PROT|nr:MAG: hypothetical protein AW09_000553 [Candidatus Accumulibacter phosphatis]